MINWQPIATAPLDGTIYDGYDVWKASYRSQFDTKKTTVS